MKDFKEYIAESKKTYYAIKNNKTKAVLSTHDNKDDADDEWEGLGSDKNNYKVVKTTKGPKKGDSMNEARYSNNTQSSAAYEKLTELNKDRVGQPILGISGKEVRDSIVLGYGTFANKDRGMVDIKAFDVVSKDVDSLLLTDEEFNNLKRF